MGKNLDDMKMIRPIVVDDSNFISSNVPEDDRDEWDIGTAYAIDDEIMVTSGGYHNIYKCAVANTGKFPPDNIYDDSTNPVVGYWVDLGATNRWRMYDEKARSYTTNNDEILSNVTPGILFNSVAIIGVVGDSVNIKVTIPGTPDPVVVYDEDIDLQDLTAVVDYYTWFNEPLSSKENAVKLDLPAYINGTVFVDVQNQDEVAQLGGFIIGTQKTLGDAVYGTSFGIRDYSKKETDELTGSSIIVEGKFSKIVDYQISLFTTKISDVYNTLSQYRAKPVVYVGNENLSETITYGFYRDFSIIMQDTTVSNCNLRIEELL